MTPINLTQGQQDALEGILKIIADPTQNICVLKGYSGTGKSTLVKELLKRIAGALKTLQLIDPSSKAVKEVVLTATTNKAAEAFAMATGNKDVSTIHAKLGITVRTDYSTGDKRLVRRKGAEDLYDAILFIDEASFIDEELLKRILIFTHKCKIIFIGDPAQITPVNSTYLPVFDKGFPTFELTEVVRHSGPILDLATKFRSTVLTNVFPKFKPDGQAVVHLPRDQFEEAVLNEFTRSNWGYQDSKVLSWTNNKAIIFNNGIRKYIKGDPKFVEGDYAICNSFVANPSYSLKTDQTVQISSIGPIEFDLGVQGHWVTIDNKAQFFMPLRKSEWVELVDSLTIQRKFSDLQWIEKNWVDLREAFACTINKSQGSTFDKVFIDLDDLKGCRESNLLARLLYVGVSRAKSQVVMTGDIV